jgi:Iap family predicted aminopeptidase
MKKKLSLIAALGCAMCLLLPQVAQAGGKLDSAIDKLIAQGWPQKIHKQLTTNPRFFNTDIGYRWAGSKADNATAKWLAGQMRAMGLSRVRLERVALDAIDYQGSSVTVGTRKMTASTYGGVRGTPFGGITGNIVYVGQGTAADFDAAGDVSGKIAVVDLALWSKFWTSYPAMEAGLRGAKALIFTRTPAWTAWCSQPDAIGSFDGQAQYASPPLVQVSMQDGEWLKQQLQAGAVTATVENRMSYRFASSGGYGYNVVGEIPGTSNARQLVVIGAHKDCYFKAALDDNSGVTQVLTLAKAMRMTGERPKRTLVFMAFTGEEFARTNCYFDFLGGSTYSITETHPDWPGRVAGMINLEGQGHRGGKLTLRVNPELKTLASTTIAARTDAALYGFAIQDRATIYTDQWPFAASGIASVMVQSATADRTAVAYHT